MNTRPQPPADAEARFDATLRDHHALAVERISPRVRAQLTQRRHAALRGTAPARPLPGLRPAAAGLAMAAVLALGLHWLAPGQVAAPAPDGLAAGTSQPAPNTILDEDPEFYAWLASADGQLLAME